MDTAMNPRPSLPPAAPSPRTVARRAPRLVLPGALLLSILAACGAEESSQPADAEYTAYLEGREAMSKHLATFDELDFDVFTNQKWELLGHSHSQDVKVHWPDGHVTTGIDVHTADLKNLFVYAPDTRIQVHPIKLGDGEYTSVTGVMEGTFTAPMPGPDGTVIQPTGKSFKLVMNTVSHWKDGVMDEEYLFWDNLTYLQQLGLTP